MKLIESIKQLKIGEYYYYDPGEIRVEDKDKDIVPGHYLKYCDYLSTYGIFVFQYITDKHIEDHEFGYIDLFNMVYTINRKERNVAKLIFEIK